MLDFKCPFCLVTFANLSSFKHHLQRSHQDMSSEMRLNAYKLATIPMPKEIGKSRKSVNRIRNEQKQKFISEVNTALKASAPKKKKSLAKKRKIYIKYSHFESNRSKH